MIRMIAVLLGLLLTATPSHADGKVFRHYGLADVSIPDQSAIIHFDEGIETLVIETRFQPGPPADEAADAPEMPFAWVVPLPSVPEDVFPASSGVFQSCRSVFQPHIRTNVMKFSWIPVCIAGLVVVLYLGRRTKWVRTIAATLILILILAPAILPSLGRAGATAGVAAGAVTVHSQRIVGDYDTVVISADPTDPDAATDLAAWLDANEFTVAPDAASTIAAYVHDGWCFVASRLRTDASDPGVRTPHPLGFRFATEKPVYPLRLTGTQSSAVDIELFVFGEGTAQAAGFTLERCGETAYPESERPVWQRRKIVVGHEQLASIVGDAPHATHLRGSLTPAQMATDAELHLAPFQPYRNEVHSREAALHFSLNMGAVVLLVLTLVVFIMGRLIEVGNVRFLAMCIIPIIMASTFGLVMHTALPKFDVKSISLSWVLGERPEALASNLEAHFRSDVDYSSMGSVRSAIQVVLDDPATHERTRTNPSTNAVRSFDDGPGGLGLREIDGAVYLVVRDMTGRPLVSEVPFGSE